MGVAGSEDYCEMCDLPLSTCVHGMPTPVAPPEPAKPAPRRTPRTASSRPGTTSSRAASRPVTTTRTSTRPRRWTAPEELVPHIVAMLDEAGEGLTTDDALDRLEERVGDQLRDGDREKSPQGELRWRTAARKARRELANAGVLATDQPGIWRLRV